MAFDRAVADPILPSRRPSQLRLFPSSVARLKHVSSRAPANLNWAAYDPLRILEFLGSLQGKVLSGLAWAWL